ncbi:DUF2493 domain-containing protein [Shouchella clausii]|uniref:DUF2493 domain-containing protein n=1 Tax=Shouchella clausii TaxID=79880 RepID=UPI001C72C076|nr:DUF2493 domain-containing protein [Shouchella clausii]MBX0320285.1 DUF2493 domain-containing protein [Shouchella clausii]
MFKVIVAGSRDFNDYMLLKRKLDVVLRNRASEEIEIVSGKARGADTLGERYAKERGYAIKEFPADWETHGKAAGHIRNRLMAEYADALVAFWDGKSRGTENMIETAKKKRLQIREIRVGKKDAS